MTPEKLSVVLREIGAPQILVSKLTGINTFSLSTYCVVSHLFLNRRARMSRL